MSPIAVRDARPDDRDVLVAFSLGLAAETEGKALVPDVLRRGVTLALAEPDRLRFWVAESAGHVVGMAAITREWSDWRCGWLWWFQSVYVSPDHRSRGVFRTLHGHIKAAALAEPDVIGLRLYVEAENARAQRTYQSLGLRPGGYQVYEDLWPERYGTAPA